MNNNVDELINNVEEEVLNMNNEELIVNEEEEVEVVNCYNCGSEVNIDDTQEIDGEHVCQECIDNHYYTCERCGDYIHEDDICETTRGDIICQRCADYYYIYCERCNNYFRGDDMTYCEEDETYYCDECYDDRMEELENTETGDNYVGSYHQHHSQYQYHMQFLEGEDEENTITYGVETEMENINGDTTNEQEVLQVFSTASIKREHEHDSSLNYGGIEDITYPFSYEYAMASVENTKEVFEKAIALGYRGDRDHCGIHIHVKRPSDEVIDRIWLIMETFKREILQVARRHNEHYAHFISDWNSVNEKTLKSICYINKNKNKDDRYYALNLTNNNTIEFRIFKSTLNYRTWYAYLQFINNIMVECSNLDKPVEDITWEDLTRGEFISELCMNRNIVCYTRVVDNTKRIEDERARRNEIIDTMDKAFKKYARQLLSAMSIDKSKFENVANLYDRLNEFRNNTMYNTMNILERIKVLEEYKNSDIELNDFIEKVDRFIKDNMFYATNLQMSEDVKNTLKTLVNNNNERGEE